MLKDWLRRSPGITTLERELLDALRDAVIPNPNALRERLGALRGEIKDAEREWERLNCRADDAAFLELRPAAEKLQSLRAQTAPLPEAIASAERRRGAFLELNRLCDALAADVAARTVALLEQPPQGPRERDQQLRALDQATRIHTRLVARLGIVCASRQFRDPPDALALLRDDLETRLRELDRIRSAGMRPPLVWPPQIIELLEVLEDRSLRKETA